MSAPISASRSTAFVVSCTPANSSIERRLGADQRCHAAYAANRPFNVQLLVARGAAGAATAAVIVLDDDGIVTIFLRQARLPQAHSCRIRSLAPRSRASRSAPRRLDAVARRLFDRFQSFPLLRRSAKTTRRSRPTSWPTSCWIASAVFFSADSTRRFARRAAAGRSVR